MAASALGPPHRAGLVDGGPPPAPCRPARGSRTRGGADWPLREPPERVGAEVGVAEPREFERQQPGEVAAGADAVGFFDAAPDFEALFAAGDRAQAAGEFADPREGRVGADALEQRGDGGGVGRAGFARPQPEGVAGVAEFADSAGGVLGGPTRRAESVESAGRCRALAAGVASLPEFGEPRGEVRRGDRRGGVVEARGGVQRLVRRAAEEFGEELAPPGVVALGEQTWYAFSIFRSHSEHDFARTLSEWVVLAVVRTGPPTSPPHRRNRLGS